MLLDLQPFADADFGFRDREAIIGSPLNHVPQSCAAIGRYSSSILHPGRCQELVE
jgi:hypothetical protein